MAERPIAVLISGGGTNLQALLDAAAAQDYPADVRLVVSNVPDAGGLERAQAAGVRAVAIDHRSHQDRETFEIEVEAALRDAEVELVCLAGFMRILSDRFVQRWTDRLLNIHPSLLPAFRGLHTHRRALDAGVRLHGCTVHLVRSTLDDGPILAQAATEVRADDVERTLAARVLRLEHRIYPLAVRLWMEGRARLVDGRIVGAERQRLLLDDDQSSSGS